MAKEKFAFSTYILEGGQAMEHGRPVPWGIRLFFGMGQAAEAVKNWGFSTLLLIYYVQVLGLPGSLAGLALAIALIFDAFSDPAVGSWSDNFKSKYGRRHPFMLAAIMPLPIFFFFLFWPPVGLGDFALFAWLTALTILTRTALTFFHVPYLALGAELTKDYHERTMIVMIRTGMGYLSSLLVVVIAFSFFFVSTPQVPDPQLTREPYFNFALISSATMCIMMLISILGTRGTIRHLSGTEGKKEPFQFSKIYLDLIEALRNNSFRALITGVFLLYIYLGVHGALATHLKTYFWHLDTSGIRAWQISSIVGGIAGVPLVPWINRLMDKKMTVIWGVSISAIMGTLPVMLQLIHLIPQDQTVLLPLLCFFSASASFAGVQALVTSGSMLGDIADEHELKHGKRQEGIYFSTFSLAAKCTSGLGNLIAGIALDIITLSLYTDPESVPQAVLTRFGLLYGLIALIAILALWVFRPYHLDKKRHEEIIIELQETVWASKD
jgi:glycoside/pentoside/hexuronide:cation symporter, GPH family